MRAWLAFSVFLVILTPPAAALAKAKSAQAEQKAYALFEKSEQSYREGRFAEAAELLRQAYELDPEPTLLFNIGRALESAGDLEGAVEAYASYLEAAPNAEDRKQLERRVENLWKQIKEKQELEQARDEEARKREALERAIENRTPEVTAPARSTSAVDTRATVTVPDRDGGVAGALPYVTVGLGTAAVAAGAMLGVLAQTAKGDAENSVEHRTAFSHAEDARSFATGANVAYAAGAALVIGGLVWLLLDGEIYE